MIFIMSLMSFRFEIVRCGDMWNSLPHVIQAEEDLVEFKKLLDWHHSIVGSF